MRHVSRTHCIDLDSLFETVNLDSNISIRHVKTKEHIAYILTKGSFAVSQWNDAMRLVDISALPSDNMSVRSPSQPQKLQRKAFFSDILQCRRKGKSAGALIL